ncbi:hypothetical protein D1007_41147 [Hordeum vulgare]|nr:hypothetical protein D1007_41147 [Hordeum vulgare]
MSSASSSADSEVDGCGIVQFESEFFIPNPSFYGLEERSNHRCPGHGLIPTRRVSWGGASMGRRFLGFPLDLPDECDWVVWIEPPPTELVGQAFEELHGGLEHSWIKASRMEKKVMDLNNENKKMQLKLKKRNELMETMGFLFVLGINIVASLVSIWSKQAN